MEDAYKCVILCTPDPFDSYYEADTMEYKLNEESGRIYFNADLYLIYKLGNEQLNVIAVLNNPCDCSCTEEHFVLQMNESKSIFGGHGGHYAFYSISLIKI